MNKKVNYYGVSTQTKSLFGNSFVKLLVPVFCIALDYFTVTESINIWFSFSQIILTMVALGFSLAIDGIPVYMSTQGDLKSEKNKLWMKVLAVLFIFIFIFRIVTGKYIISTNISHELAESTLLAFLAKVFSAALLTVVNIATSLLCYYIGFKSEDHFLVECEDEYTSTKRELFELDEVEQEIYHMYDVDQENKEIAKEFLQSYVHLWKLLSEVALKNTMGQVSDEELNELYEEKMVLEKKALAFQKKQ